LIVKEYDALVIGAGHNGLACACYLVKAGFKTVIVEKNSLVGGMSITEEITQPGFHSDVHAFGYQFASLSPAASELNLLNYGLEFITPDIPFAHAFPDGDCLHMSRNFEDTCDTLAKLSKYDASKWRLLFTKWLDSKEDIIKALNSPPDKLSAYLTYLENKANGLEEYRFDMQTLRSFCEENFESEKIKCFLGSFALHTGMSPDDVGGGRLAWLFDCIVQDYGNKAIKGGMSNLIKALSASFSDAGGEIITESGVKKILTEGNRATGVSLRNGDIINVNEIIASSIDPGTLIVELLGERSVGKTIVEKMKNYDWGLSNIVMYISLNSPLDYIAGKSAASAAYVHASQPTLDYASRTAAECRAGLLPGEPFLVICNESAIDPGRAPKGKGLIKILVHTVPYEIRGDAAGIIKAKNWAEVKEAFADRIIDILNRDYIKNLKKSIMRRVVHSPIDQENKVSSAVHGTWIHGALLPYQSGAMRPIPELGQYKTPLDNVYLCGSGSYPGPGISFMPGRNAAQVILKEGGLELPRS
jgi:phytoene dehydrogenase-like protein